MMHGSLLLALRDVCGPHHHVRSWGMNGPMDDTAEPTLMTHLGREDPVVHWRRVLIRVRPFLARMCPLKLLDEGSSEAGGSLVNYRLNHRDSDSE